MVELRKRKAPTQLPVAEKRTRKGQRSTTIPKGVLQENESPTVSEGVLEVGNKIILDGFGGEIETNDGIKTTLNKLVNESKSGVVLFTYPRASTPGCKSNDRLVVIMYQQACMFRDNYDYLTSTGFSIYGLSADSPRANTTFKAKQSLPYPLLCDTTSSLIAALGFKKAPKGTTRGIFAVDKEGTVLLLQPGGPDATVEAMRQLIARNSSRSSSESGI
ncbi:disrupter of telomere silencing protein Dot5 [Aspergillus arachidicola]|uniref:thioredoxin-dependent peroxiredoxin n=1 Tax=Aspergillus arachidicola TaxID=656916 RepID=A0A2G7G0R5_9EURO|nr:disrupter of telomere silencing protein Dot5 [Aspergillus arachidicola]